MDILCDMELFDHAGIDIWYVNKGHSPEKIWEICQEKIKNTEEWMVVDLKKLEKKWTPPKVVTMKCS